MLLLMRLLGFLCGTDLRVVAVCLIFACMLDCVSAVTNQGQLMYASSLGISAFLIFLVDIDSSFLFLAMLNSAP